MLLSSENNCRIPIISAIRLPFNEPQYCDTQISIVFAGCRVCYYNDMEAIKEAITMTKLGQMIRDDAIKVGEQRISDNTEVNLYLRRRPLMICALLLFYSTNEWLMI